ncbi:hypothetical protein GE09DRAFT_591201 [Coniochaeta sp. 2T2.1]|nr:hypothetical protein GE09DRAFT_591201 [Coniochaeta sp. 2T2.1]
MMLFQLAPAQPQSFKTCNLNRTSRQKDISERKNNNTLSNVLLMAEVLGIAASGVALAQVAGQILTTSLFIKRLINDIKELPESFKLLLNQVDVLTPVLLEASSSGPGSESIPSPLESALGAAALQCSMALDQLRDLASELLDQLEHSRGLKRRLVSIKIAVRKDTITKLEQRLSQAVSLLSIAQQTCLLSLQRMQPGLLASLIVNELEARKQSASRLSPATPSTRQHPQLHAISCAAAGALPVISGAERGPEKLHRIRLGLRRVTGVVEIEIPVSASHGNSTGQKPTSGQLVFGLKIQLPSWLSWRILDSSLYQSHIGWTQHFRTYNIFGLGPDTPFQKGQTNLRHDDVETFKRYFADRVLTPYDRWRVGLTLLNMAILHNAWTVCNYLLEQGASLHTPFTMRKVPERALRHRDKPDLDQLKRFIQRDQLDDSVRVIVFGYADLSTEALYELRRSLWPDSVFFSEPFYEIRTQLVTRCLRCNNSHPHAVEHFLESVLYNHGRIDLGDTGNRASGAAQRYRAALQCLAEEIARCVVFYPRRPFELPAKPDDLVTTLALRPYASLIRDLVVSARDSSDNDRPKNGPSIPDCLRGTLEVPITHMVKQYLRHDVIPYRKRFSNARPLENAQVALQIWLYAVKSAGIDLLSYAALEMRSLQEICGRPGKVIVPWPPCQRSGSRAVARLLGITYGPEPEDWQLWWTEPTDVYAGEFWRTVERDIPLLPGSWVDDKDEDDDDRNPAYTPVLLASKGCWGHQHDAF